MLLFVANTDNASIFSFHIATKKYQPLVRRTGSENIQGLAFDPVKELLFWTDATARSIQWMPLSPGSISSDYGKVLIQMDNEIPRGIAVDSCRGYVYWTNINSKRPTIERAKFDGSDRKVIVDKNIFMPINLEVEQGTGRLYWADDKEGIHYSIESCDLDGNNRRVHYQGIQHNPNALAVSKDHIFWTDWAFKSVWKLAKNADQEAEPTELVHYNYDPPFGVVARYDIDDIQNVAECGALVRLYHNKTAISETLKGVSRNEGLFCLHGDKIVDKLACKCHPGYTGDRCEVGVCQQFCVNGECSVTDDGLPVCKCSTGYGGDRCEVSLCHNYCSNNGVCSVESGAGEPTCECPRGFEGKRCEAEKKDISMAPSTPSTNSPAHATGETCNCSASGAETQAAANETPDGLTKDKISEVVYSTDDGMFVATGACEGTWDSVRDPLIAVLGTFCALLSIACGIMLNRIMQLKKRPRIKKRIIVNKNLTPLTARPDQCEITIENCCNMNVCETPCFEPSSIRANLKNAKPCKEEKSSLISNMERPDNY
ncbi:Protein cueball [Eumeta japonica]|uniref:Protein cueball n=1 Tax=Eumeta variegata TaxID=151549 RepID=A0A4C1YM57_EUMVA|nr:Protein cueball [Eumeta japonica]